MLEWSCASIHHVMCSVHSAVIINCVEYHTHLPLSAFVGWHRQGPRRLIRHVTGFVDRPQCAAVSLVQFKPGTVDNVSVLQGESACHL